MIRGRVKSVVPGVIQRVSATVWGDGSMDNREFFQHYGYTSRPLEGAEVLFDRQGGMIIAIASDDRRYRIALEAGEVALYTDEGDKIHLKRDRVIEIVGGEKIVANTKVAEVNASERATVTSPIVAVVATTSVTLDTPLTQCTGNLDVTGDITAANVTAAVNVADAGGAKNMAGMREVFDAHTHAEHGDGGGTTSPPAGGM